MVDYKEQLLQLRGYTGERRRKYFLWKNGLDTTKTNYSQMSKQEFIDFACDGSESKYKYLQKWEDSEMYKEMMYSLHHSKFDRDILEVYQALKKESLEGNISAVKAMVDMQQIISDKLTALRPPEDDEEDDLIIEL